MERSWSFWDKRFKSSFVAAVNFKFLTDDLFAEV